ncbi:MAG: cytochrome c oxidase assembly protein [Opitutales bacterium]
MPLPLHWHTEPFLLLSLLGAGWLFVLLMGPFRSRFGGAPAAFPWWRVAVFLLAIGGLYLTVGSPLDQLGEDYLFSAHMIQHMLLIYLLPPLFLVALPRWLTDTLLAPPALRWIWQRLTQPVFAGIFFTLCYSLWHIPILYEAALHDKALHILEHVMMFVPALFMWWPILGNSARVPPISYGSRMLYVFVLMILQFPVFGVLCFSGEALYPTYTFAPRIIEGFTALQDQVLGGVIMKVVNMGVSLTILAASFYAWYREDERQQVEQSLRRASTRLATS